MQKDELIQLHSLLCQVKRFLETEDDETAKAFVEYARLGVAPQHIHKSKMLHKKAVFLLGREIAGAVAERLPAGAERDRLVARFNRLAEADGRHESARSPMSVLAHA